MPAMLDEHEIPAREAGRLQRLFDASLCPMEYGLGHDKSQLSVTRFARVNLHGIDVIRDEGLGQRTGIRKPCHVEAHRSDNFLVCVPHQAEVTLDQAGRRSRFTPGSFSLLSTAQPFSALISAAHPRALFSHTIVRVPGPRLRARLPNIDDCCGTPLAIRAGIGRVMTSLLELALNEGGALNEAEARRFGDSLIDAIAAAALAAPELATLRDRVMLSARERLRERARQLILSRLSDPDLSADEIARDCGVSVRYLRAAFAEAGESVGSFMREARLRECRNALRDPTLREHSVMAIALRWGFNDAAYFSRTYRRAFGIAPSSERRSPAPTLIEHAAVCNKT